MLNRRIEIVGMHASGREFPLELAITRISDDPPMYTGFLRDIGDRKAHEAENEWLASIVRSSDDAIISRDLEGDVTAWNHGAELLYGYSAEEAIGRPARRADPAARRRRWDRDDHGDTGRRQGGGVRDPKTLQGRRAGDGVVPRVPGPRLRG